MNGRCPKVDHAFTIIGKKWNAHIIHLLLEEKLRFSQIVEYIPTISAKVLTCRLIELENEGIIIKEGFNKNGAYRLTDKGQDLYKVILEITKWSQKYC
ncbi:MAG: winged helix-turn-helix transcriptional regulator [Bacilli bacterium]